MAEMNSGRPRKLLWPRVLLALLLVGGSGYGLRRAYLALSDNASGQTTLDKYHLVKRGDFNIIIPLKGTLDAIKRHDLRCEVRRHQAEIVQIVEDKSEVKKGDVIVKFSPTWHQEKTDEVKQQLEDTEKELAVSIEDIKIKKTTNLSDIKSAVDSLRAKREALQKYLALEAPKKRKEFQRRIATNEQKVKDAQKTVAEVKEKRGTAQSNDAAKIAELDKEVKKKEAALETARQALEDAYREHRVYRQYDHPQKLRKLREDVAKAHLKLQQVIVRARSNIIQAQRRSTNHKTRIKKFKTRLEQLQEDMQHLIIRAPVDGIVSLGAPQRRHWQETKEIKVGSRMWTREIVASIPDLSRFQVRADVPEAFRSQIKVGLPVTCRSPAVPDLVIKGEITFISPMASQTHRWDRNSPKIYATKISTETTDPRLRPGMTVNIEIVAEQVAQVLFVPKECLYNREGATYCKVRSGGKSQEKKVKTGRASMDYVEIISGLKAGDKALLFRQPGGGK